ncbi:hypothetical protein Tco_1380346, partial [Tanacetum coccineum]
MSQSRIQLITSSCPDRCLVTLVTQTTTTDGLRSTYHYWGSWARCASPKELRWIGPMVDEDAEPVAEVEVEQVIAPVVGIDEDIAMLFGDDDFEDDASEGFDDEDVWEVNEEWLMAPVTPPPMLAVPPITPRVLGSYTT